MEEDLAYIDDFIEIETYTKETFETSHYTGISDFFYSHLQETNVDEKVKLEGINVFKIQVGNIIKVAPSKWAISFSEKHDLPRSDDYDYKYEVKNIVIEYYSKNPNADTHLPKLHIKIVIEKV